MNVLMLLNEEFPPDSRVEKEALSLMNHGYKVTIACYTRTNKPSSENYKGMNIKRMKIGILTYKFSAACLVIPYYFWLWKRFVKYIIKDFPPDFVHVHDLPLSAVGSYISKKSLAKLVCDQHEFYSDWIVHTAHMNTTLGKIVKALSRWKKYEKKYLKKSDLVITVAEPLRIDYINTYKIDPDKIITVPNTPSLSTYNMKNIRSEIVDIYRKHYVLFYAGGIDILRGIDTAIMSLPLLEKEIPNIKLVLAGKIINPYDPFASAKKFNVEHLIEFLGWVDEEDLPSYIYSSKVCFFTPPVNRKEINNTIATKIYQYAIMGKPIISSNAKMMADFVTTNKLGYVVEEGNYRSFATAVVKCNTEFSPKNVKKELLDTFTWEKTVKPLILKYQQNQGNNVKI